MKQIIPSFSQYLLESLNVLSWDLSYRTAKSLCQMYMKNNTIEEIEIKVRQLAKESLEKYAESEGYSKMPKYNEYFKSAYSAIKRKDKNISEEEAIGFAIESECERLSEQKTKAEEDIKISKEIAEQKIKQQYLNDFNSLRSTKTQNTYINMYKKNIFAFSDLNEKLRNNSTLNETQLRMKESLDEAISLNKIGKSITVFRIVDLENYPKPRKNSFLIDKGFMSTSVDIDYLIDQVSNYDEPLIIKINIESGTEYLKFSNSDFESELLFGRNHKLTYTTDILEESSYQIVNAKLTPST